MPTIAILGKKDTYSEQAASRFIKKQGSDFEKVYYKTTKEVVKSLDEGITYAVLPFENTLEGYVNQHMDLLIEQDIEIINEVTLDIQFNYVKRVDKPRRVYVQYVAKNQCLNLIESLNDTEIITTESNSESYEKMLQDEDSASIIPSHLTVKNKHWMIKKDISDTHSNHTRFLILTKRRDNPVYDLYQTLKVTLLINVGKDKPGLLYEILKEFAKRDMSLISIMSRPTKNQIGTYHFFIELYLTNELKNELQKINEIERLFQLKILGIYKKIEE